MLNCGWQPMYIMHIFGVPEWVNPSNTILPSATRNYVYCGHVRQQSLGYQPGGTEVFRGRLKDILRTRSAWILGLTPRDTQAYLGLLEYVYIMVTFGVPVRVSPSNTIFSRATRRYVYCGQVWSIWVGKSENTMFPRAKKTEQYRFSSGYIMITFGVSELVIRAIPCFLGLLENMYMVTLDTFTITI